VTPSLAQLALAIAVKVLLLAVLVGVLRHGLHRRCWSFLIYLLVVLTYGTAELAGIVFYGRPGLEWPRWLWSWDFWQFKQTAYEVVNLAVAVELGARVVAAFPGTWGMARTLAGLMLLTTTAAVALGGAPQHPLLATATIWLFAGVSLVAVAFHLPIRAWYRALLMGFVPYLFVFSTLTSILDRRGLAAGKLLGGIDQVAYLGLVLWWAYAAWRGEERVEGIEPAVLRRIGLARA
jgi:hypothetical protein